MMVCAAKSLSVAKSICYQPATKSRILPLIICKINFTLPNPKAVRQQDKAEAAPIIRQKPQRLPIAVFALSQYQGLIIVCC